MPRVKKQSEPSAVSGPEGKRRVKRSQSQGRGRGEGSQRALGLVPARLKGLEGQRWPLLAALLQGRGCLCLAAVKTSEQKEGIKREVTGTQSERGYLTGGFIFV